MNHLRPTVFVIACLLARVEAGQIEGSVNCPGDKPTAGAVVVVNDKASNTKLQLRTDAKGNFETFATAGEYDVTASSSGCAPVTKQARVLGSETVRLQFLLGPPPRPDLRARGEGVGIHDPPSPPPPPPISRATPPEESKFSTVRIFYATDRKPGDTTLPATFYSGMRGGDGLQFGTCEVSIPFLHQEGELEAPSWWRLEYRQDPERHVVLLKVNPESKNQFLDEVRQQVTGSPTKDAFVFVHGFNVTFEDAARRTAQIAFDLRFQGAPVLYSWPSRGKIGAYAADEATVDSSARHLRGFLDEFRKQSGATTIHLIAHSMGGRVLTSALENLPMPEGVPKFKQVVLAAPDIDADSFRQLAAELSSTSERVTLYASSKDRALAASKVVHREPRAGDTEFGVLVVKGVDTIDASLTDTEFLGHSYFESIVFDLRSLFGKGLPPGERPKLESRPVRGGLYWLLRP